MVFPNNADSHFYMSHDLTYILELFSKGLSKRGEINIYIPNIYKK